MEEGARILAAAQSRSTRLSGASPPLSPASLAYSASASAGLPFAQQQSHNSNNSNNMDGVYHNNNHNMPTALAQKSPAKRSRNNASTTSTMDENNNNNNVTPSTPALKKAATSSSTTPSVSAVLSASEEEEENGDKDAKPSKVKVTRACSMCKKSHAACDNNRPCSRCVSMGKSSACVDAQAKKRGRKPRSSSGNNGPASPTSEKRRKLQEDSVIIDGSIYVRSAGNVPITTTITQGTPSTPHMPFSNSHSSNVIDNTPKPMTMGGYSSGMLDAHSSHSNVAPMSNSSNVNKPVAPTNGNAIYHSGNNNNNNTSAPGDASTIRLSDILNTLIAEVKMTRETAKSTHAESANLAHDFEALKQQMKLLHQQNQHHQQQLQLLLQQQQQFMLLLQGAQFQQQLQAQQQQAAAAQQAANASQQQQQRKQAAQQQMYPPIFGVDETMFAGTPESPRISTLSLSLYDDTNSEDDEFMRSLSSLSPTSANRQQQQQQQQMPIVPLSYREELALMPNCAIIDTENGMPALPFLINSAENPFIMLKSHPDHKEGAFIAANYPFLKLFGYSLSELIGCSWRKIVIPEYQEQYKAIMAPLLTRRSTKPASNIMVLKPMVISKSGITFQLVSKHQVFYDERGAPVLHIISSDVQVNGASVIPIQGRSDRSRTATTTTTTTTGTTTTPNLSTPSASSYTSSSSFSGDPSNAFSTSFGPGSPLVVDTYQTHALNTFISNYFAGGENNTNNAGTARSGASSSSAQHNQSGKSRFEDLNPQSPRLSDDDTIANFLGSP